MNLKGVGILVLLLSVLKGFSATCIFPMPLFQDSVFQKKQLFTIDTLSLRDSLSAIQDASVKDSLPISRGKRVRSSKVYLPDSLIRKELAYEYTKIKDFAYKSRLTKELYKMFFVNPHKGSLNVIRTQNSEERFRQFQGKKIRHISVKILPPFGTSVYDTNYVEEDIGWLKWIANKTHMSTAEKVIFRQLTFKSGMLLQPFELVENEILLRKLDYIDDVLISVIEDSSNSDWVDVMVICKDQLSWSGSVESNFLNSFKLGIDNKNFLRLGHVLNYEISYRGSKEKEWGNILEYKINSIWGSYFNVRGYYQNDYREKEIRFELERSFLTSQMKWAVGLDVGRIFYSEELPDRNVTRLNELFNYHFQDFWFGKSFQLPFRSTYNRNVYLTGRLFTTLFHNRPCVSNDTNQLYHNRVDLLGAFTFSKVKYYKANLIYDFGRTEDIPVGLLVGFTGGYEKSEYDQYGYIGTEIYYSHFNQYTERYYALGLASSSYIGGKGLERGIIKVEGKHIGRLYDWGSLKFRFYNKIRYVRGVRRYAADYLYMEDQDIRGFVSDSLCGNQKLATSFATTFFLPYIKKGFRVALSAFLDAGVLAPEKESLWGNRMYWGIGLGMNLRNDNVVFKNLHFRLTFYPVLPTDGRAWQVMMNNSRHGNFYDYRVTKPQVIPYE